MAPADADHRWFRARPNRRYRLRRPLPGETGPWVIVKQISPGVRLRAEVELGGAPGVDEETARRLFEQLARREAIVNHVELALTEPRGRA
jgi:hypothetical protein